MSIESLVNEIKYSSWWYYLENLKNEERDHPAQRPEIPNISITPTNISDSIQEESENERGVCIISIT